MSVVQKLKEAVGIDEGEQNRLRQYRCDECGHEFESARSPRRVNCPECLSHEVDAVGTVEPE